MDNTTQPDSSSPAFSANETIPPNDPAAPDERTLSSTQALFKRMVDGAHDTVDGAAAKVAPVVDGITKVGDTKDEWIGAARDTIREHPFAAIATALLVGAAYVSLTGSRRR